MSDTITIVLLVGIAAIAAWTFYKAWKIQAMVFEMQEDLPKQIDNAVTQVDRLMALYTELNLTAGLPATRGWAVSPDMLLHLVDHVKQNDVDVVVECGSGVSTIALAHELRKKGKGHIYSLEHETEFGDQTRQTLEKHGLSEWVTIVDAPLTPQEIDGETKNWYKPEVLPDDLKIDLIFVDGPPEYQSEMARYPAGPKLFTKLNPGGAAFIDDARTEQSQKNIAAWKERLPDLTTREVYCEKGGVAFIKV